MSVSYSGIHSITFFKDDDNSFKNTWGDFHMVPTSRPYITAPPAQIKMVSLPRSNKILDLTNSLTRNVTYEAREGDWEFYIDHDQWEDWTKSFDDISEYLDGSVFHVIMGDEPLYSYKGRVYVSDYSPESNHSKIRVHYNLDAICEVYEYTQLVGDTSIGFTSIVTYNEERYYVGSPVEMINIPLESSGILFELSNVSYDIPIYLYDDYINENDELIIIPTLIKNIYGSIIRNIRRIDSRMGNASYSGFALFKSDHVPKTGGLFDIRLLIKENDIAENRFINYRAGIYTKIDEIVI